MRPGGRSRDSWGARPFLAAVLRLAIFAAPIVIAVGVTISLRAALPRPHDTPSSVALWCALVALAAAAAAGTGRLLRRLRDRPAGDE